MAPEQAGGDRATDVHTLGFPLHAPLTGRPPFLGDAAAALHGNRGTPKAPTAERSGPSCRHGWQGRRIRAPNS